MGVDEYVVLRIASKACGAARISPREESDNGAWEDDGPFQTFVLCANSVPTQPNEVKQENTDQKNNLT